MFCSKCGKQINQEGGFCPECGAKISENTDIEEKSFVYFRPKKIFGQWLLRRATMVIDSQQITTKIKRIEKIEVPSKTSEVSCYCNYLGKTGIARQSYAFESGKSYVVDYRSPLIVLMSGKMSIKNAESNIEEQMLKQNNKNPVLKIVALILAIVILFIVAVSSCSSDIDETDIPEDTSISQSTNNTDVQNDETTKKQNTEEIIPKEVEIYNWIDQNDTIDDYEISQNSLQFISKHPDFFPGNDKNSGAMSDFVDFNLKYKHLSKSPEKYNNTLVNVIGTVIDCDEIDSPYGTITYLHIQEDETYNNYCLYYLGEIEIFEDDWIYVYALPFDIIIFDNMSGAKTEAVIGAASLIMPAGTD